jgi:hypothetical protein
MQHSKYMILKTINTVFMRFNISLMQQKAELSFEQLPKHCSCQTTE